MANRFLNNITINDAYTFPSTDGSDGQAIITDGAGNLSFGSVAAASATSSESTHLHVKNTSGSLITKGTPVYITGNVGNTDKLEIAPADASSASTMPAVGLLETDLANNGEGFVVQGGLLKGLVTGTIDGTSTSSNDTVYVKSGSGLTMTKPTGASNLIQNIAKVARVHGSNGSLVVSSILRANDVPNLTSGKIWVGDGNTIESTVVEIDETNNILIVDGKIYYSNVFSQESDLPSATTYHGMFAHVHGTGYAYYAHAGAWVKLARHDELVAAANDATITLTAGTGLSGGGDFTTDQATNETITVNLDNTAVTPGTYGDADNTPQITIDQQGRITSATTIPTAGAGGGGGGSVNVVTTQHTGDGTTRAFALDSAPGDNDAVQVYLNGVYQVKDAANYSISGSTLTFVTAPTNSTAIELVHFISEAATSLDAVQKTGDGNTQTFDLGYTITDEKYTFVFIQGVYQEKSTYTTSGSSITFSTAPQNGYTIEVMVFGTSSISEGGGISWDSTVKTSAFTAVAGEGYFVNTTSAAITVTLPGSPTAGDEVSIVDYAGTADTNNITITSSDNINGTSDDVLINYERGGVSMVYVDATQGWIAYNAANETARALVPEFKSLTVDYLVVAGGGAGGSHVGGGGGAGGLRTSYGSTSGGGASAETSLSLLTSTNYTVSVGPGGAAGAVNNNGGIGYDSVFSAITSDGGGGGGSVVSPGDDNGLSGGSGGGASGTAGGGDSATGGSGTANQGFSGGDVGGRSGSNTSGAGGGGAASAGASRADASDSTASLGNGGDGIQTSITGTSYYFSGGGGAGTFNAVVGGAGGLGGGGGGASTASTGGTGDSSSINAASSGDSGGSKIGGNGANNSGGGGGGGGGSDPGGIGGSGGSGVVILRYPSVYSISETTSPSVLTFSTTTDGSDKVTTFTAGVNGTIEFS